MCGVPRAGGAAFFGGRIVHNFSFSSLDITLAVGEMSFGVQPSEMPPDGNLGGSFCDTMISICVTIPEITSTSGLSFSHSAKPFLCMASNCLPRSSSPCPPEIWPIVSDNSSAETVVANNIRQDLICFCVMVQSFSITVSRNSYLSGAYSANTRRIVSGLSG